MYRATVKIRGVSPLSQSRLHGIERDDGETHDAHEQRTWREKANYDTESGEMYVPAMAFKQAMDTAAKRLSIKEPGASAKSTMTKYFQSDVIAECNLFIGIYKDQVGSVTINANVDGVRGSNKRVRRTFPQTPNWGGTMSFLVSEPKITHEMFENVLRTAGRSIGVGQFRPERGGLNGRFEIISVQYENLSNQEPDEELAA